jgi:DNA-binding CsgD family transcriptional regulator
MDGICTVVVLQIAPYRSYIENHEKLLSRVKEVITLHDIPLGIESWETLPDTLSALEGALKPFGVKACVYFMTAPFHSQVSRKTAVFHFGFPEPAMSEWLASEGFENDPVPDFVEQTGEVMTWQQVVAQIEIPDEVKLYMESLFANGLHNSIIIPLYGPNQRASIAACLFGDPLGDDSDDVIGNVVTVLRRAHYKVCLLVARDHTKKTKLSKREGEVLNWMARGKSNPDIATILGISAETVDTYARRLYPKLGVHDRVSAVFAGMSRGMIRL